METCLAREASTETLNKYLPDVRRIIINLLQGLKRKQSAYRARSTTTETDQPPIVSPEDNPRTRQQSTSTDRTSDHPSERNRTPDRDWQSRNDGTSATTPDKDRRSSPARRPVPSRSKQEEIPIPDPRNTPPTIKTYPASPTDIEANDAIAKLSTSDALQRRVSKRFSAYNFSKLDGIDTTENPTRNGPPPVPQRRSGTYSPEATRSPSIRAISPSRRRSPERRVAPVPEEIEDEIRKISGFLQVGSTVRKTWVRIHELTIQSLRLLFVEKFQYNPGEEKFPEVLITDKESGVKYILESMQDIFEGSTLTLDIEGIVMDNLIYNS